MPPCSTDSWSHWDVWLQLVLLRLVIPPLQLRKTTRRGLQFLPLPETLEVSSAQTSTKFWVACTLSRETWTMAGPRPVQRTRKVVQVLGRDLGTLDTIDLSHVLTCRLHRL